MKSKIKTWSIGEGQWKMHIPNWEIYKEIRDTLKLKKDKKFKPVVYMQDGDNIAWDIDLTKEQLEKAKQIIKNFK
jgi:hypothetical protein|tara:strand:- start:77 stop:301 length:225 start_codon:yes stop_codon:yes gene_type:complete